MIKANGIHHIAIMAADIREHIAYFSDVMGFQLSALFDMHGVPGGVHAFLHMDDHSYFSVVQLPAVKDIVYVAVVRFGISRLHEDGDRLAHKLVLVGVPERC